MPDKDVVILGGARTPMAEFNGHFANIPETELGAHAVREALARVDVPADAVDHTIMGNAMPTSPNGPYGARHVALKAGIPEDRPALTVNRMCGSGIQSIVSAGHLLRLDEAGVVAAGGMENMSMAPYVLRGVRTGWPKMGMGRMEDSLVTALLDTHCGCSMADTAENLAGDMDITRREMDEFALRSQERAQEFHASGKARDEIAPFEVPQRRGPLVVEDDDHRRPGTTIEALARLRPAFRKDGTVTGGNASGIVDGAAAVVVTTAARARELGREPLGRVVAHAVVGVEPRLMGIGPAPAIQRVMEIAGLDHDDVALYEINEAFAGQYLAVEKTLGLDREKVNVNGGAIALGHPLGATGTRLVLTLLLELRRRGARHGVASACIGGGQGIAILVENLS